MEERFVLTNISVELGFRWGKICKERNILLGTDSCMGKIFLKPVPREGSQRMKDSVGEKLQGEE